MQFVMVGHHPGKVNDRSVEGIVARIVGAQLMTDGLLDLHRHAPGVDELGADFRIVAPEIRLLDFRQRFPKGSRFRQAYQPARESSGMFRCPMSREKAFEKNISMPQALAIFRHQAHRTLFRQ